ncbi:MAG TPA: FAD-dependent oxidoreductase [Rhizobium sp.]|nr:FAD-dependent oxidoreductase [Rhizobium sp.]
MSAVSRKEKADASDVVIIGGGVVGMCLAYGITRHGLSVTVVDEGDDAFRASRGNFALVWVQGKGIDNPDYARWTSASANLWQSFAAELSNEAEMPLFYARPGGLMACLSENELERRVGALERLRDRAPDTPAFDVLDHEQMKKMLPAIGPEVVGGTYCAADGHVNALRLLAALHRTAGRRGVIYRPGEHVGRVTFSNDGFRIHLGERELFGRKIILAAGLGNKDLAPQLGLRAPLVPQRGQIMVTEKLAPFLGYPLGTIRQTNEGGVMIGDSKEDVGFDKGTDSSTLAKIATHAIRTFPRLAGAQVVRSWGALRIMSPDGYPIYDRSRQCPGAYLVTCHSGITLAAAHATIIAKAVATDVWPETLHAFSAERFDHVQEPA